MAIDWRVRATNRQEDLKIEKQRSKELLASRNRLQEKLESQSIEITALKEEVYALKKKNTPLIVEKPNKTHFSAIVVQLFLSAKIKTSVSFRSLSKILLIYELCLNMRFHCKGELPSAPSAQTGLLWVKKLGYYQLQKPKTKADDWILIVDESVGIGQEKALVVLGIRRSEVDFTRALKLEDMEPLLVKSKEKRNGIELGEELAQVEKQIGKVLYVVSDGCCTLTKGLRTAHFNHVYDITHSIALGLEKVYKNDPCFQDYIQQMNQMRRKLCNSKHSHLIPPNQRSKARFLNIDRLSNWGMKALKALEKAHVCDQDKQQLLWSKDKAEFIEEMNSLMDIIRKISLLLKTSGLSKTTKRKCISILKTCKKGRLKKIRAHIIDYLNTNVAQVGKWGEKLICCSDIIESTFGKYKNEIGKNPMNGITDLALIIPAFTSDLSIDEINKAIDYSTVKDIKQWSKANLCESLSAKRHAVFKKVA